jgi:acyl dehydratase
MERTELGSVPTTGSIYRRAVSGSARRGRPSTLPDQSLRVAGISAGIDALAAYDRVCGFRLSDRLPATYPHVMAFPLAMRLMSGGSFPFPVIGVVHIANSITLRRPISMAAPIDVEVHAANLRPHDRGQQFDVIAAASVDGDQVWRGVSTYLRRSGASASPSARAATSPVSAPTAIWSIGADAGRAYARVSGDRNPIHTSRLGAKAFGFPGPIAHGMWTAARCLAALEGTLPEAYTFDVAFQRPILLPSTVAFAKAGAEITVTNAKSGEPHLRGSLR